jgi:ABC-type branched-subunit amino acid transport system substrate-binding protein
VKYTRAGAALLALLLVATAACSRGDDTTTETDETTTTTEGGGSGDASALASGGFGDLEEVCKDGDASGATATGVTDTEIRLGTVTDKGFAGAQGLNKEMYDAAVAFADWCNEHGGILGRDLVVDDLDAALTEYEARITEACEQDFALVGGGAVFDEDPNGVRVACNLPNIAGYVVSEPARNADLQVQPLPNPSERISIGRYHAAKRDFPEGIAHYGIMASNLPAVLLVRDQMVETAESLGFTVDYDILYAPQGETGWANFVADMQAKDIKILEYVGQPADLVELNKAMDVAGWQPDVLLLSGNFYDAKYAEEAGAVAPNLYIQSQFHPFELAADNQATQDYLDLMEQYNPDGKVALLGVQATSAYLLFAVAAAECGSDLTAECLLEKAAAHDGWTGGGLHAPQSPGNEEPSPCWLALSLGPDGFTYNEEATAPTEGLYNCSDENVADVSAG